MRKFLLFMLSLSLLLFRFTGAAFAAEAPRVEIPVVIEGGGTAYMISEVNSPLPTDYSIRIDNGRTGHFYIDFTRAGEFHYTVKADFSKSGKDDPADNTFRVTVTVEERKNGSLFAVATINSKLSTEKVPEIRFEKPPETETTTNPDIPTNPGTPETPTTPDTPTTPGTPETPTTPDTPTTPETPTTPKPPETPKTPGTPDTPGKPKLPGTPRTGDESHLTYYVLIAIASSAGLFLLALLYTLNTNKLIRE